MKVACVLMLKNETEMLDAWLQYHSRLFGIEHLYLLDNGSTDSGTLQLLKAAEGDGASVDYRYSAPNDFTAKGDRVLVKCRDIESRGYEMLLPLDCDEFVAVEHSPGQISIEPSDVQAELIRHRAEPHILKIGAGYDNSPSHDDLYFRVSGQSKCFFAPKVCARLDIGFHAARSFDHGSDSVPTRIVYIHRHFRPWAEYVRSCKEKLNGRLADYSAETLKELVDRKGEGFHLAMHLLAGEANYYARFDKLAKVGGGMPLPAFASFLKQHGLLQGTRQSDQTTPKGGSSGWLGAIDSVVVRQNGELLTVRGWAFHPSGLAADSLQVEIDGQPVAKIERFSHARPDVTRVHPAAPLVTGYELRCKLDTATAAVQSVSVVVPEQQSLAGRRFAASQACIHRQEH